MADRLLSLPEVAALTSTSVALWRKLIARRVVPTVRIGRLVRVRESTLEAYLRPEHARPGELIETRQAAP